jgi:hypothetical protein
MSAIATAYNFPDSSLLTTTNGSQQQAYARSLGDNDAANWLVFVTARSGSHEKHWQVTVCARRVGTGNARLSGTPVAITTQTDDVVATAGWAVSFGVSSADVVVNVTGQASTTIDWSVGVSAALGVHDE